MNRILFRGLMLLTIVVICTSVLKAQNLQEGEWKGFTYRAGSNPQPFTLDVTNTGKKIDLTWELGTFPLQRIRIIEDTLKFMWDPDIVLNCALLPREGKYMGSCVDPFGMLGVMIIAPPGVGVTPDDLDVDFALDIYRTPFALRKLREDVIRGRPVQLGDALMNVYLEGTGDVTVILEAGLGDSGVIWSEVHKRISKFTRVFAYDRAGLGFSESSSNPRTPEFIAQELHALLEVQNVEPPYIVVGHGAGGFYIRKFAALYPDEVVGMVLADADHEAQAIHWKSLSGSEWEKYIKQQDEFYKIMPPTVQAEYKAYREIIDQAYIPDVYALPDVPLVVLTADRKEEPRWIGETADGKKVWQMLHKSWVDQVTDGTHVIAEMHTGHFHQEAPERVAEAVKTILGILQGSH